MRIYSEEVCGAYNQDTDKLDKRKIKVECPSCSRVFAALCSRSTSFEYSSNHGYEYDDYVSYYSTTCGKCGSFFKFGLGE